MYVLTEFFKAEGSCTAKYFWKTLTEICTPHLYASFGIFFVQIGSKSTTFSSIAAICRFANILQRLTAPRIIDQFGRKSCQKKRKDMNYELLYEFAQKYFFCTKTVGCQRCIRYIRNTCAYVLKGLILGVSTVFG